MGLDLFTATDHRDAYVWAAVLAAHFAVGLGLVAAAAALIDRLTRAYIDNAGDAALLLVGVGYAVVWEGVVQRLGAGWADALIDTVAVICGGAAGLYAWRRKGGRVGAALLAVVLIGWRGVRSRSK